MAEDFSEHLNAMSPERRARIERRADAIRRTPLYNLRKALHLTQEQVADELGVGQAAISRFERRPDMYLSTLRRFVEALGGELEVRALFPGGDVVLDEIGDPSEESLEEEQSETVPAAAPRAREFDPEGS